MGRSQTPQRFAHCGVQQESPMPPSITDPRTHAQAVVATTARAWKVSRESPRALARRAPRGYVPTRLVRRLRGAVPVAAQVPCGQACQ